jgi:hypothetical protein
VILKIFEKEVRKNQMKKIVSETSMKEIRRKIILKNRYDELFF